MKICSRCKENKKNSEFYKDKRTASGLTPHCRDCQSTKASSYFQANKTRLKQKSKEEKRAYNLMYTYGITLDQYEELLKKQNYSCAVCKKPASSFKSNLAVDHEHGVDRETSGVIRGLLCIHCNRRIIGRTKEPEIFLNAAKYLQGPFTGWFVPVRKKKRKWRRKS